VRNAPAPIHTRYTRDSGTTRSEMNKHKVRRGIPTRIVGEQKSHRRRRAQDRGRAAAVCSIAFPGKGPRGGRVTRARRLGHGAESFYFAVPVINTLDGRAAAIKHAARNPERYIILYIYIYSGCGGGCCANGGVNKSVRASTQGERYCQRQCGGGGDRVTGQQ